jgi:DNA-binding FadR family transcriptional regulator
MVAVEVIGQLAARASETDVAGLRAHLRAQHESIVDPASYVEMDLAFARKLVAATGNTALLLLTNTIVRVLERNPGMEAVFLLHPEGTLAVYERLLDLVEERDPERARFRARRMLASLDHTLLSRLRSLANEAGWEAWR